MEKSVFVDNLMLRGKKTLPKDGFIKIQKSTPQATKVHTNHTAVSFERHNIHMQRWHIHQTSQTALFPQCRTHLSISLHMWLTFTDNKHIIHIGSSASLKNSP